jgi:hypothetical protein
MNQVKSKIEQAKETIIRKAEVKKRKQMGPEYSKLLFLQLKPGEHPNYPEGKEDNTHFSELGARLIAQQIFREILVQFPELATRVVRPAKKS